MVAKAEEGVEMKAYMVTDTSYEWRLVVIAPRPSIAKTAAMGLDVTDCGFTDYVDFRARVAPEYDHLITDDITHYKILRCSQYAAEFIKAGRCDNCRPGEDSDPICKYAAAARLEVR